MKTIYDGAIHGFITLPNLHQCILDTPEFQRLRRIKQLGCAVWVYPGASHTRFEHSLGVYHLATRVIKHLKTLYPHMIDYSFEKCLTVAALCHDLGHLAYSHVSDEFISHQPELFDLIGTHEDRSIALFKKILRENALNFHQFEIAMIAKMIAPDGDPRWQYNILSSDDSFDIDRGDYVLRDSANVGIGCLTTLHSVHKIIASMRIEDGKITYDDKAEPFIKDLLSDRLRLHKNVYQHRVSTAVAEMVHDILDSTDCISWSTYEHVDDGLIYYLRCLHHESTKVPRLLDRLDRRDLYFAVNADFDNHAPTGGLWSSEEVSETQARAFSVQLPVEQIRYVLQDVESGSYIVKKARNLGLGQTQFWRVTFILTANIPGRDGDDRRMLFKQAVQDWQKDNTYFE